MYKKINKGIRKTIYVKYEDIKFYKDFIKKLKNQGISVCDYLKGVEDGKKKIDESKNRKNQND